MSSEPIEGEISHLEAIPIFSPYMPTLDVSFKPILDPDDSFYALSPKTHDDPKNPPRCQSIGVMKAIRMIKKEQPQWL